MNEYEVLQLFIGEIEPLVSVPVRMSNHDDEHEGSMVLLDSLDTTRRLRSMDPYIGQSSTGERLQYYHDARLDITVQSESEDEAYQIRQNLIDHFRLYERSPKDLSGDIVLFKVGDGGNREAQFEPTVFRLFKQTQTFEFSFVDETEVDVDVIAQIEDNL